VSKKTTSPTQLVGEESGITDNDVVSEMKDSFLEYSMSVILARALPDVRDGLKPVHRRILYTMSQMNLRPKGPFIKCAKVTGDTMGKYHPHGDSAIYESLVRMAQSFSLRLPLIDGHGNFGSLDFGAAASRYTECRMQEAGVAMTRDLDEDTVDLIGTYDNQGREPLVLPSAFPNMIVNGGTGIAVGMATNMAPHNLSEALAGAKAYIANPDITVAEMMKFIPGPDLPTGGVIVGTEGIVEAYTTGRGAFRIRGKVEVGDLGPRRRGITITELPYLVGPESIMLRIKELVNAKRLQGIADVRDLSDHKHGLRLVIQVKTGFDPHAVLEELYKTTKLEDSFSINNVALVGQRPETLGIVDLVRHYVEHRRDVVRRRTLHRRGVAEARLHIVDGLILALSAIDEVIATIRSSKDTETARTKLIKQFTLSEIQATHILEMALRRLTSLEVSKLKNEKKEIHATIKHLTDLLEKKGLMDALIVTEFDEVDAEFGTPRRTKIVGKVAEYKSVSLEIADDPCLVTLSVGGILSAHEVVDGVIPPFKLKRGAADVLACAVRTSRRASIVVVTNLGRSLIVNVAEIPVLSTKSRGAPVGDIVPLSGKERVVGLVPLTSGVVLATSNGAVKRIADGQIPTKSAIIISLKDDDELVGALPLDDVSAERTDLLLVTSDAQLLRTTSSIIPPKGAAAGGIAGMKRGDDALVIAMGLLPIDEAEDPIVVVTQVEETGAVKVSAGLDYPAKGRGGGGVRCHTMKKGEATLSLAYVGPHSASSAMLDGTVTELPAALVKRDGSGAPLDGGPFTAIGLSRP
jgi:DNA gyrase subunit A